MAASLSRGGGTIVRAHASMHKVPCCMRER
jgi:hypothetical protein